MHDVLGGPGCWIRGRCFREHDLFSGSAAAHEETSEPSSVHVCITHTNTLARSPTHSLARAHTQDGMYIESQEEQSWYWPCRWIISRGYVRVRTRAGGSCTHTHTHTHTHTRIKACACTRTHTCTDCRLDVLHTRRHILTPTRV